MQGIFNIRFLIDFCMQITSRRGNNNVKKTTSEIYLRKRFWPNVLAGQLRYWPDVISPRFWPIFFTFLSYPKKNDKILPELLGFILTLSSE